MKLNLASLSFNLDLRSGGGTPAWGTELGQGEGYKFFFDGQGEFLTALLYNSVPDVQSVFCPLGKGGNSREYEIVIASLFNKVFVNGHLVLGGRFLLLIVKKISGDYHVGRRTIKYSPRITYHGEAINADCFQKIEETLNIDSSGAWFVYDLTTKNQDELHFSAAIVDENEPKKYPSNEVRRKDLLSRIPGSEAEKRQYFEGNLEPNTDFKGPRQQIYFGAPGTGKSFEIDKILKDKERELAVPAESQANNVVPVTNAVAISNNELRNVAESGNENAFPQSQKYFSKTNIFRTTFHPDSDYNSFVGCFKPHTDANGKITYAFVPQVFLKAYITAVNNDSVPVFLVIEEINRGNCAQIFGDLFQLLDRNELGESEYSIDPDQDIREFLAQNGVPADKLKLPSNLYIWATMNTSDQSLFPIDSAFKRRWEWKYVPIKNADLKWEIDIAGTQIDWWQFLEKINAVIEKITQLEDKKLGYFFVKAGDDKLISADTFVSKVLFYLWEDVFKNYGFDDGIFKDSEDSAAKPIAFRSFFKDGGEVDEENVLKFLKKVVPEEFENQNSVPAESQNGVPASE